MYHSMQILRQLIRCITVQIPQACEGNLLKSWFLAVLLTASAVQDQHVFCVHSDAAVRFQVELPMHMQTFAGAHRLMTFVCIGVISALPM